MPQIGGRLQCGLVGGVKHPRLLESVFRSLGSYSNEMNHCMEYLKDRLIFLCESLSGYLSSLVETSEAFLTLNDLPQLFSTYRTESCHITDAAEARRDPSRTAGFD